MQVRRAKLLSPAAPNLTLSLSYLELRNRRKQSATDIMGLRAHNEDTVPYYHSNEPTLLALEHLVRFNYSNGTN
jgi:hypothetical protein